MQHATGAKPAPRNSDIRYQDYLAEEWIRLHAPCRWQGNVEVTFGEVPYAQLEPAGSCKRPRIVARWLQRLRRREPIAPLIVIPNGRGTYYVREGNHRHEALRLFLGAKAESTRVRVAVVAPEPSFRFRYRWFGTYGTYVLEPKRLPELRGMIVPPPRPSCSPDRLAPLLGRTLVIAAHPDDETACAVLLQRMREPAIVFLTEGAPAAEFFWHSYGSQQNYAAVRRAEALQALAAIGIGRAHFLSDLVGCGPFRDQELYLHVEELVARLPRIAESVAPEALLVPAYEGGHPDHDVCSFVGYVLGRALDIPVWEMPLYHRSASGCLVHQQFAVGTGAEVALEPTVLELQRQNAMVTAYASQTDLKDYLMARRELYRLQAGYDYSRPPYPWPLNYEIWEWPMIGTDICRAFLAYGMMCASCFRVPALAAPALAPAAVT
jgi:LmbE family N-acetylglucosaminyl deacetylase